MGEATRHDWHGPRWLQFALVPVLAAAFLAPRPYAHLAFAALLIVSGVTVLKHVVRMFRAGTMDVLLRGYPDDLYERDEHPSSFWMATIFNGTAGLLCLAGATFLIVRPDW